MKVRFPAEVLSLVLLWLCMIAISQPFGNFPLIDDYTYAETVFRLIKTGDFVLASNTNACAFAHIWLGVGVCHFFGASYESLRWASLTLGLAGVLVTFGLMLRVRLNRILSWLSAAMLAVNPDYFLLSCTFMTDVLFFVSEAIAIYCFVSLLRNRNFCSLKLLISSFSSVLAVLTRQFGIALPIAFSLTSVLRRPRSPRAILVALIPALIAISILLIFERWAQAAMILPVEYAHLTDYVQRYLSTGIKHILLFPFNRLTFLCLYIALFSTPILIWLLPLVFRKYCRWFWFSLVTAAGVTGLLVVKHRLMPVYADLLKWNSLGLIGLRDVTHGTAPVETGYRLLWIPSTFLAVLLLLILSRFLIAVFPKFGKRQFFSLYRSEIFCALAMVLYFLPLIIFDSRNERYFLPFILPALTMSVPLLRLVNQSLTGRLKKQFLTASALIIAGSCAFTVCGTHDYFCWNVARWEMLNALMTKEKMAEKVDGGYEFNGTHYHYHNGDSCWRFKDDGNPKYVIAFAPINGYHIVVSKKFVEWMPSGKGTVCLLQSDQPVANAGEEKDSPDKHN